MICTYFNIEKPTPLIIQQIKSYNKTFGLNYAAIGYTLWYVVNILDEPCIVKYGIYQVKNEYMNAEKYFLQQQKVSERAAQFTEKKKTIKFKPKLEQKNSKYLINLTDLFKGDNT